jgi:hypothetical protein
MIWLGIAYAVALTLAYACILAGKAADTLDNTTDEHAQGHGIGAGDIFQHRQLATSEWERDNV